MGRIGIVFGTRPEAIKMAPVVKAFQASEWETKVIVTGQHREMLDQVLDVFQIEPDYDLDIMRPGQSLAVVTSLVLTGLEQIFAEWKPDYLLVHGDTTSALGAALAGFYQRISVAHVEAGLRTGQLDHPFPEEANRRLIDQVSTLFFAPTKQAGANLSLEGVSSERIFVTGNTVIDALQMMIDPNYQFKLPVLASLDSERPMVLVTAHRRENWGEPLENICAAIARIAETLPINIVFSLHKNPQIQRVVHRYLDSFANVFLIEDPGYREFINLLNRASFIVTDSGGLQEEAVALGKPVLVLRDFTERPEGIDCGATKLVGTNEETIVRTINMLVDDPLEYQKMVVKENPFGDGNAALRIKQIIDHHFMNRS